MLVLQSVVIKWFVLALNVLLWQLMPSQAAVREAAASPLSELLQTPEAVDADEVLIESTRNFLCIPLLRIFNLELSTALRPGESIGLTGDHSKLGEWQVEKSLEMNSIGESGLEWYLKVAICASDRIYYRYFVYYVDERGNKRIRVWEGQQHARVLESYEIYRQPGVDTFGVIFAGQMIGVEEERGWLRYEHVIELKFVWQRHIKFARKVNFPNGRKFLLKLLVFYGVAKGGPDTAVEISRYAYNRSQLRQQPERGVVYAPGDIVIFHITEPLKTKNSYQLLISTVDGYKVGEVPIMSSDLRASEGTLNLPILSPKNQFQIGALTLPYVIIKPLPNAGQLNFRGSFHHYWPLNWPSLDIGHRGTGKSYYHSEAIHMENTIESFMAIQRLNGDMVEFDVQLTKDYVPVVWYDFGFYTAPQGREVTNELDLDYVLIKDLSYMELKESRVFVNKNSYILEYTDLNVRDPTAHNRLFPTLAETYQTLPNSLGIIVEIKWPQRMRSGRMESSQTLDKNHFVNVLFQTTAQYGCGRPLIFSSFDADICTILRHKQNAFPVMFLSVGKSMLWEPYADLRTRSFVNAINFAQSEDLLGTSSYAEELMFDAHLILLATHLAQVVFVWGDPLNEAGNIEQFKQLEVAGIIYDQMDVYDLQRKKKKRRSFFEASELREIFSKQCTAVGNFSSTETVVNVQNLQIHWYNKLQGIGL